MASSDVVILGGGFGGARAALVAREGLESSHRVTLIDRRETMHLCGMNPMLVVGERDPATTTRSISRLAERGVDFRRGEVTSLDLESREITTDTGVVPFDHLVVALGASYDWSAVPGSDSAHSFYSFEEAVRLRDEIAGLRSGTIVIAAARPPYKCPPAPLEMGMLLHWLLDRRGVRDDFDLKIFIPEPAPLGVAGPDAVARVRAALEERHIELHTAAGVVAVSGREASFSDGSSLEADLIVTVPVHQCPGVVVESGLTEGGSWVPVHPDTLETSVPGVFAIGDVNVIQISEGKTIPKAGVFASGQAETVGRLIASRVNDQEPPPAYDGQGECFLTFSDSEAALVGGTFLGSDGPRIGLGEASEGAIRLKEEFEQDWRRFVI